MMTLENQCPRLVGLIGIGLLGHALAARWIAAGWEVVGYDNSAERRVAFAELGGTAVDSSEAVARRCRCTSLCLPDSTIVTTVAQQIVPIMHSVHQTATIIDASTGDPLVTEQLALKYREQELDWIDATIAGSSEQVRVGEAVVLVGATDSAWHTHCECLTAWGQRIIRTGGPGSAARMKLVVNLAIGLHRAVLGEALGLAHALELDLSTTLSTLLATPAYSRAMEIKGERMIRGEFLPPQARLAQHSKDVQLMIEAAARGSRELPFTQLHATILQQLIAQGFGDHDNSVVVRHWLPSAPNAPDQRSSRR